jgi:hypothetical protein
MSTEPVKNPEHEKLIEILKFEPCTYKVVMYGYGGEYVMGTVERKVYDYFKRRRLDLSDYAWDHGDDSSVPEDMQPFWPGSWHDCDDMGHAWGVDRNAGTLQILDENDEVVYEASTDALCGDEDEPEMSYEDEVWIDMKPAGTVVFVATSSEKGTFFEGHLELQSPFDITKLTLEVTEIDGNEIISGVKYKEEDVENYGGDTSGKSSDFGFYVAGTNKHDGKGYEKYRNMDDIDYPMTGWFPKKINPVRTGSYLVKTAGKNSYTYQAKWTGARWISSWQEDTEKTESIKIKEWQGLAIDPDLEETTEENVNG